MDIVQDFFWEARCNCCTARIQSTNPDLTLKEFMAILPKDWYIKEEPGAFPSVICKGCQFTLLFHIRLWLLRITGLARGVRKVQLEARLTEIIFGKGAVSAFVKRDEGRKRLLENHIKVD